MRRRTLIQLFRHAVALAFVGFFVVSFFVGSSFNPEFIEIARSPFGLFAYFIIVSAVVFIPSFTTVPVVVTATIIWGPYVAGAIALAGWTIAGLLEYAAGYFAKNSIVEIVEGGNNLEEKIERVTGRLSLWQVILARSVVPSFIFGMVRVRFRNYLIATIINFLPWAVASVLFGELLRPFFERIRPWIFALAFVIAIFVIDYFFIKRDSQEQKPQLPAVIE